MNQRQRKYDSTVARIAGNILSGAIGVPLLCNVAYYGHLDTSDAKQLVQGAVLLARAIVAETDDAWPDVPFTAMRARKIGAPVTSEAFARVARYRGLPHVRCGDRVRVGTDYGTIVGHNDSANFNVLFDAGSKYGAHVLNVHPHECVLVDNRQSGHFAGRGEDAAPAGRRP